MASIKESLDEPSHEAIVVSNIPSKFDVTAAAIKEMQDQAESMSIDGPDDREGYNAMSTFRKVVKRQRIAIEKRAEELKAPHKDYLKKVDEVADSLIDPMKAIENNLALQEKTYNDERERIAHERAMFLQNRMEARVQQLRAWGFVWNANDDLYEWKEPTGEVTFFITFDDIKELDDEAYEPTRVLAEQCYTEYQSWLKQQAELAEAERQRIEAEQKAEADRLAKIAADQRAEAERLVLAERQLREAEERARQMELKARLVIRTSKLVALGFVEEEFRFVHPSAELTKQYITDLTDQDFEDLLPNLADHQRDWEATQQREELNWRISLLREKAGFVKVDDTYQMLDVYNLTEEAIAGLSDKEFIDLVDRSCEINDELVAKQVEAEEQAKKQADKDRQKRLAPEKEKLRIYLESAADLIDPKLKQPEAVELQQAFDSAMEALVNEYIGKLDTL